MHFDVTYAGGAHVPSAIAHRVVVSAPGNDDKPMQFTVTSAPSRLNCEAAMVLSPPFKGDGWVNANGCGKEIGPHRFVMNSINGHCCRRRSLPLTGFAWTRKDGCSMAI